LQTAIGDLEDEIRRLAPDAVGPATDPPPPSGTAAGDAVGAPRPERAPGGGARLTEERAANMAELVRLGREYMVLDPTGGLPGFLGWLSSALRGEDRSGVDSVEIVTFHAAKGLEWSIVHVAGLEEGFVPIHHARDSPDDIDEERRLLYVALTRARDELHCSWARSRAFGSRTSQRKPSPWLEIVASTVGAKPQALPRSEGAARARAARDSIPKKGLPAGGPERELFDALRQWRRAQAKEADVAAFVIFNDATLVAVAEARPKNRAELLRVSGIGAVKAQRFGEDVLRIVTEH